MAAGLLTAVWAISFVVCSPPWVIPSWNLFIDNNNNTGSSEDFKCAYSPSVAYRIYSALGSFYLPLLVMLFVYFKIFRVASEREALMRQSVGTCRLSNRLTKTQQKNQRNNLRWAWLGQTPTWNAWSSTTSGLFLFNFLPFAELQVHLTHVHEFKSITIAVELTTRLDRWNMQSEEGFKWLIFKVIKLPAELRIH